MLALVTRSQPDDRRPSETAPIFARMVRDGKSLCNDDEIEVRQAAAGSLQIEVKLESEMAGDHQTIRISSCACGRVRCQAIGAPILTAVCYCDDCQAGGRQIENLPDAVHVLDDDGGTPYLSYRDDRFSCVSGADLLVGYKIRDRAPTQRFVASCCNSGMFLKFKPGHWVSAYRARFLGDLPPIEMRTQTKFRLAETPIPRDAPSYQRFPMKLFGKLLASRVSMLIGR